jgi:hypothetical protein
MGVGSNAANKSSLHAIETTGGESFHASDSVGACGLALLECDDKFITDLFG